MLVSQSYRNAAMDGLHKSFRDAKYISSVDMESGFWNAPLEDGETQALTAFNSMLGKFQFKCVPMGLQPASGFRHRLLGCHDTTCVQGGDFYC